ncbi:hypothetical protein JKP88DRAFT_246326 [Tribonema minus]|uniref:Uncharacterized protein n=1 Tax=Tribonema minus TaxID=303371 RepID=A0A835YTG7_9STRA|nr:hypothetical protein JKP88DRAFT_246326 [Tribonema minus]
MKLYLVLAAYAALLPSIALGTATSEHAERELVSTCPSGSACAFNCEDHCKTACDKLSIPYKSSTQCSRVRTRRELMRTLAAPQTDRPTTRKPTTRKPTTRKPTTRKPTTRKPTTRKPTSKPSTRKPTTRKPTSKPTTRETTQPTTAPAFHIELRFDPSTSTDIQGLFIMAAQIWERIITADVPDEPDGDARGIDDWFDGDVPSVATNEPVDDVIIAARVGPIDGPFNILASAGPKFLRSASGLNLPVSGVMNFDIADVQSQIDAGTFLSVILHEMGHVLGIGTLWPTLISNCAGNCVPGGTGATYANGSTGVCFAALKAVELGLVAPLALGE